MKEGLKLNIESQEKIPTATENFVKNLDHECFEKYNNFSDDELEDEFIRLTQTHRGADPEPQKFKEQELGLLQIEYQRSARLSEISDSAEAKGGFFDKNHIEKFKDFGGILESVEGEYQGNTGKPYWILIPGLPISGKATLRRLIAKKLEQRFLDKKIVQIDRDYSKIFPDYPWQGDINIVEDVHGLDAGEEGNFDRFYTFENNQTGYDLLIYPFVAKKKYAENIVSRIEFWLKSGVADLTDPGTKKEAAEKGKKWIQKRPEFLKEDITAIRNLRKEDQKIIFFNMTNLLENIYKNPD
ncbi:MAG: hypothetical protein A2909_01340 [Candidatus Tagabacteria bacterium RIFCSPLOWO2_01_FULL_39_11]|uniref:Uncharacterized protein n=1 Tax=Candidatus Tagabacteria bacterium RIFCSPLOWO2_01_FULL_39_11 TaxID=1802295 RepID=A0A1G2LNA0_9BACT|nr:MAG: hypothetical protein A2909_01340 [Candidatus Tagabacteria bacterium RIFCSPLOWO2_01_FULL_39_11]